MRFRISPPQRITAEMAKNAYLSGLERVSWPVQVSLDGNELLLQRAVSDSANLHLSWPVEGSGYLTLMTGSLIERREPYLLPLELARGVVCQVRNQLADWQLIGLTVPAAVPAKIAEAVAKLSWAVISQSEPAVSAEHAEGAIQAALNAADMIAAAYTEQLLTFRRRSGGKLTSLLGANIGSTLLDDYTSRQYLNCFNAAQVPLCWREIEAVEGRFSWAVPDAQIQWCRANGLKVFGGPLLMLDPNALPDWLYLFADEFDSLLDCLSVVIREVVERYRGKVDYWICAGRVNTSEAIAISEQERLRLAAHAFELVRTLDPNTPALISFDQPWAEYMRQRESDFPPIQFADALLRAGLDMSGLMLEINAGYSPNGTMLRHPLDLNRQLDAWSMFGLPLWLSFSAPSAYHEDSLALRRTDPLATTWSPASQQAWAAKTVPLALAKPAVQGVLWNQLTDSEPHDFPHGGLFNERRHAKLALRTLSMIRQTYLK
jgi:hypothetical protein